jgi:DNA-binding NarL/FixJ family response regulator
MSSPVSSLHQPAAGSSAASTPDGNINSAANASQTATVNSATSTPANASVNSLPKDTVTISPHAASLASNPPPASDATASATAATSASAASNATIATALLTLAEQVQQLASQGWSVQQIAWDLNLPVSTVQSYVGEQPSPSSTSSSSSSIRIA